jgi:hypothetical protein
MPRTSKQLQVLLDRQDINQRAMKVQLDHIDRHETYLNELRNDLKDMIALDLYLAEQIKKLKRRR